MKSGHAVAFAVFGFCLIIGTNGFCDETLTLNTCTDISLPEVNLDEIDVLALTRTQFDHVCRLHAELFTCLDDYFGRCYDSIARKRWNLMRPYIKYICGKGRELYLKTRLCPMHGYVRIYLQTCINDIDPIRIKYETCDKIQQIGKCAVSAVSSCGEDAKQFFDDLVKEGIYGSVDCSGTNGVCDRTLTLNTCTDISLPEVNLDELDILALTRTQFDHVCRLHAELFTCFDDYPWSCLDQITRKRWNLMRPYIKYICGKGREPYLKSRLCPTRENVTMNLQTCINTIDTLRIEHETCENIQQIRNCAAYAVVSCGDDAKHFFDDLVKEGIYELVNCSGTIGLCDQTLTLNNCTDIFPPEVDVGHLNILALTLTQFDYVCRFYGKFFTCLDDYLGSCYDLIVHKSWNLMRLYMKYICGKGRDLYLKTRLCSMPENVRNPLNTCLNNIDLIRTKYETCDKIQQIGKCAVSAVSSCSEDAKQFFDDLVKEGIYGSVDCSGTNGLCDRTLTLNTCTDIFLPEVNLDEIDVLALTQTQFDHVCRLHGELFTCLDDYFGRCYDSIARKRWNLMRPYIKYICGKGRELYLKTRLCPTRDVRMYLQICIYDIDALRIEHETCDKIQQIRNCSVSAVSSCGEDAKQFFDDLVKEGIYAPVDCSGGPRINRPGAATTMAIVAILLLSYV